METEDAGSLCLTVHGRLHIGHSFSGKLDLPLHGITFLVHAAFSLHTEQPHSQRESLSLRRADEMLHSVLRTYDRRNLDLCHQFAGENTTCERIAHALWNDLAVLAHATPHLRKICVKVRESDVAYVEYKRALGAPHVAGKYVVAVRARCMVGRDLQRPPAEAIRDSRTCEGATLVVDALFGGETLDPAAGFLFDICLGERLLGEVVEPLHQCHLRDVSHPLLGAHDCESVASMICAELATKLATEDAAGSLETLRVVVRESDVLAAEAACALPLPTAGAGTPRLERCLRLVGRCEPGSVESDRAIYRAELCIESANGTSGSSFCAHAERALSEALEIELAPPPAKSAVVTVAPAPDASDATVALSLLSRRLWSRMASSLCAPGEIGADGAAGIAPRVDKLRVRLATADKRSVSWSRAVVMRPPGASSVLVIDVDAAAHAAEAAARAATTYARAEFRRIARLSPGIAEVTRLEMGTRASEDADTSVGGATPTGIAHHTPLGQLLQHVAVPLVAISDLQGEAAARAALATLGLSDVPWWRVITPKELVESRGDHGEHPPAYCSRKFWEELARSLGRDPAELALVGGAEGSRIHAKEARVAIPAPALSANFPLVDAVLATLSCRSPAPRDAAAYLHAKREVDERARNKAIVERLTRELSARRAGSSGRASSPSAKRPRHNDPSHPYVSSVALSSMSACRVIDVGAGSLSMLAVVEAAVKAAGYDELIYEAIDSDGGPLEGVVEALVSRGDYRRLDGEGAAATDAAAAVLPGQLLAVLDRPTNEMQLGVRLELWSGDVRAFASARQVSARSRVGQAYDLLVASAFADLMCPEALISTLVRLAPSAIAYLPITFCGRTELQPEAAGAGNVPSDKRVSEAYHAHLRTQGQHFDVPHLLDVCERAEVTALAVEPSDWRIEPSDDFFSYLLDFLSSGTAVSLWRAGFDAAGWRRSVLRRGAAFSVGNVDLLLALPPAPVRLSLPYRMLEFSAPRAVHAVSHGSAGVREAVGEGRVELRSVVSMISSGTELLVYRGQLDESDEPLDATIVGMSASKPSYPMAYGYSLVGVVTAVGAGAPLSLVGETVFAFAPHGSAALVDASCIHRIPADLSSSPADAAFIPAAETAISIAHDAHPRLGESIAIFGAGIIGLLTAAALSAAGVSVSVFDPQPSRLPVALALGAIRAVAPTAAVRAAYDVTIECSGNPVALQTAIESTREGGKLVVASWYGSKSVALQLGTRFHRSHIRIVASQVSRVPAAHGDNWSKHRRFGAAWDLIRRVRPSQALRVHTLPLERAAEAYQALDEGTALVCHLSYG